MAYRDDVRVVQDMGSGHYDIGHGGEPIAAGDRFDTARGVTVVVGCVLVTWDRMRRATVRAHEARPPILCTPFCFMEEG